MVAFNHLFQTSQTDNLIIYTTSGRYNFKIKTLGWFNVDAFYEGLKGTEIVDLKVSTDFEAKDELAIHVFFPQGKT